jgi:hypothetical protein
MKTSIIAVLVFALVAISSAQICPRNINDLYRRDDAYNLEYFSFPSFYNGYWPFNVTDNQYHQTILQFTEDNIQLFSFIGSDGDLQIAIFFDGRLTNNQERWTTEFHAIGTFSPFSLRTVPDFKWVTLYDIEMRGRTSNNYRFNVSISYADFWSDSPADNIWSSKSIEHYPYTPCKHEHLESGGYNYVQSKGFWIEFSFERYRLNFYVPQNIPGFIYKETVLDFWTRCTCPSTA